jgi:hypothetical protein
MAKVPVTNRYYEPIPGETHKAWLAFCVYRDMGLHRSLDKAWRGATGKQGRHARHWAAWSAKNHWVSRCQAYDNAVMRRARRQIEDESAAHYAETFSRLRW